MTGSVPALSFVAMGISLLFGVAIPVGLFLFYYKKHNCKIMPFFIGCGVFVVFALVLEGALHAIILGGGRAQALMAKPLLYGLYGGFMAGLFEETGRFVAFKTILKKSQDDDSTALMYGAGHGGFEAFYLLFAGSITNLVLSVIINTGNTGLLTESLSGDKLVAIEQTLSTLISTKPLSLAAGVIERIPAVALHISLSVLVWFGAKNKDKWYLYPIALIIHFAVDAVVATLAMMKTNTVIIEVLLYVLSAAVVMLAMIIWKRKAVQKECPSTESVIQ